MRSAFPMIALGIALAIALGMTRPAYAEDAPPATLELGRTILDADVLDSQRGGADTHLSEIRAVGSVSEVQAYDLVTGHNIVSDSALSGASGLPMVIQNSGNGVLIQNAVILNVQVQ